MKKLIAYLLSFLILAMPSVALACEAAAMQGFGAHDHEQTSIGQQAESCHQQANDQQPDDSRTGLDCPWSALCVLASPVPLSAASIAVVASGSFAVILPPSSGFLSADSASLFRPPID